jgi:hypothetical protein
VPSSYPVPSCAVPVSGGMVVAVPLELLAPPLKNGRPLGGGNRSALVIGGTEKVRTGGTVVFCKVVAVAEAHVNRDGQDRAKGRPGGPDRDPPRARLLPGRDQRDRKTPEHRRPRPAPPPQVQVPVLFRARHREGHRHPHRPCRHHHGQRPSLTSESTVTRPRRPPPDRGPGRPARHADPRHAIREELPAVIKNRNYPQPVKHLKPTALGRGPRQRLLATTSMPHRCRDNDINATWVHFFWGVAGCWEGSVP